MPTIDVRDTKLYYEMVGAGDPPLVFVHGMCTGGWGWQIQMAQLSSEFTCVAYDRRGHSRSEPGVEDQSDRTHADDLAALIEALELDRPIVVGSSSGAVIAVEMVRSYPDLVHGAVLMEPPLFSLDPEVAQQLMGEMVPKLEEAVASGGTRAAVDAFFQMVCARYWADIDEAGREHTLDNAHLLFPTLESEAADVTIADLASIDLPTLVISGTESPPAFRAINQTLVDHLPNARHVEVADSGHVVYAEKPDEFAQAVRAFAHEVAGAFASRSA